MVFRLLRAIIRAVYVALLSRPTVFFSVAHCYTVTLIGLQCVYVGQISDDDGDDDDDDDEFLDQELIYRYSSCCCSTCCC